MDCLPKMTDRALSNFIVRNTVPTVTLLIVTTGFIGLLWLTQSLIRRGMDDSSNG